MTYAYIFKRRDSSYYWLRYWEPGMGRYTNRSTRIKITDAGSYKKAVAAAREAGMAAQAVKSVQPASEWSVWVPQWLQLRHGAVKRSLEAETGRWKWLDAFLEERKVRSPDQVEYQLALDYLAWRTSQTKRISKKHPKHNTALAEIRLFSRILGEAVHRGFIRANPLAKVGIKKHPAPERPELSDNDVQLIREELKKREGNLPVGQQWMTVSFEIALAQGCRVSETSIPMDWIDEKGGTIRFLVKRGKIFTTALNPDLLPLVERLRKAGCKRTCVLPRMKTKHWHFLIKSIPGSTPGITFHSTRVTVITRLARAGVPISQAMAFVGHADQTVHRVYQRLCAGDLGLAVSAVRRTNAAPGNPGAAQTKT